MLIPSVAFGAASLDYELSDATDRVDYGDAFYAEAFSFSGWYKFESLTGACCRSLVHQRNTTGTVTDSGSFSFQLLASTSDLVNFGTWEGTTSGATTTTATSATAVTTGVWIYLGGVNTGTEGNNLVVFNDAEEGTTARSSSAQGNATSAIQVGARIGNNDARWMDGLIAQVQMWTSGLSYWEHQEARWKPGIIAQNLIIYDAHWDASNIDLSGNGKNGTDTGVAASNDGPPVMIGVGPL